MCVCVCINGDRSKGHFSFRGQYQEEPVTLSLRADVTHSWPRPDLLLPPTLAARPAECFPAFSILLSCVVLGFFRVWGNCGGDFALRAISRQMLPVTQCTRENKLCAEYSCADTATEEMRVEIRCNEVEIG